MAEAGIRIDGERPWDLQVHDARFYRRILGGGSLALGESYMDGWWDAEALDESLARMLRVRLKERVRRSWRALWTVAKARLLNLQSTRRAYRIGRHHYDRGNDLYRAMLDRRMVYSCAYWKEAETLDEAQEAKLDLICRKIGLQAGHRVLDVGCGWGSFARFAAERYGAEVVGVTVSEEQVALGRELCRGLPVEIRLQDYRALEGQFDRIVSVGMFEHVGYKNYGTFMDVMKRCLKPEGLLLLHSIGTNISDTKSDPWINAYIFPNGMAPSARQIAEAAEGRLVMEDWHNIGPHYDPTLMAWHRNFEAHWDALKHRYDERFYRMWRYYLLACAGTFRARYNHVWQIVFSHRGLPGGYTSIR